MAGSGFQVGPLRPDWGHGWADLKCDQCDATWTGPTGETCTWCQDAEQRQRQWQAELTLKQPDIDPDDRDYDGVMKAWRQRLKTAVKAELITEREAANKWKLATGERPATRLG